MEPIADARGILLAAICILALMIGFGLLPAAYAATRLQSQDHRPTGPYTMEEYNAEQACANDKNPSSQVKCLDAFVSKYPNSQLLPYAYLTYCKGLPDDAPGDEIR